MKLTEPDGGSARTVVRERPLVTDAAQRHALEGGTGLPAAVRRSAGAAALADLGDTVARPIVIKIGGRALDQPGAASELAAEVAALAGRAVLVHGGGGEVSAWCARLGLEPQFANGLRVTDPETLEVATAVLAGLANKRLVAALREGGVDAVGIAALDGGIAVVQPHLDAARLGAVGEVTRVDPALIDDLLRAGRVPVIASIAAAAGALLNLNADDLAAAIAGGIGARALLLISDVPGVILNGKVAEIIARADLDAALASGEVQGGMRPKLNAARAALDRGVARVHIGVWSGPGTLRALLGAASGTVLTAFATEVTND